MTILPFRDPKALSPAKFRHKIPLFFGLAPSEFESLAKCLVRRRYPAGQALFHMGDEGGSHHFIEHGRVKVTQKDLASMISATRESINKQLKAMRDQGLVRISGRTIEILNRERLALKARIVPKP